MQNFAGSPLPGGLLGTSDPPPLRFGPVDSEGALITVMFDPDALVGIPGIVRFGC